MAIELHCRSDGWGPLGNPPNAAYNPASAIPVQKWVVLQHEGTGRQTRETVDYEATLGLRELQRTAERRLPAFKAMLHTTHFNAEMDQDVRRVMRRRRGDVFQVSTVKVDPAQIEAAPYLLELGGANNPECVPREVVVLGQHGTLPQFKKAAEKGPIDLTAEERTEAVPRTKVLDDPIVHQLVEELGGNEDYKGVPVCVSSDEVLAALMVSPKSVQGWDVQVFKGSMPEPSNAPLIVIDRTDKGDIDASWINETGNGDEIPTPGPRADDRDLLRAESTRVNFEFRRFCASRATMQPPDAVPPKEKGDRRALYVYRLFMMSPGTPRRHLVLARGEIDCGEKSASGLRYFQCNAFLEFRPKVRGNLQDPWRDLKDGKKTAATQLMLEHPRNAHKLAKWTAMALLAKADMKVGFVRRREVQTSVEVREHNKVRVQIRNEPTTEKHDVIAVETVHTERFRGQISLDTTQMWSTLEKVLEIVHSCPSDILGIAKLGEDAYAKQLVFFRHINNDSSDDEEEEEGEE